MIYSTLPLVLVRKVYSKQPILGLTEDWFISELWSPRHLPHVGSFFYYNDRFTLTVSLPTTSYTGTPGYVQVLLQVLVSLLKYTGIAHKRNYRHRMEPFKCQITQGRKMYCLALRRRMVQRYVLVPFPGGGVCQISRKVLLLS